MASPTDATRLLILSGEAERQAEARLERNREVRERISRAISTVTLAVVSAAAFIRIVFL